MTARAALFVFFFSLSHAFAYSVDPKITWQVLRTPHFEIIYDKTQRDVAEIYALAAEQAHAILAPVFNETPSKTIINIVDDRDSANGMAMALPYPTIQVYPVFPNSLSSIDDYGQWAFELILHEYAHILTFQPAHGFYTPLKYIFGNLVTPNAILPRWYLEGLAVDIESRYSNYGRLKSFETSASLRALAEEDQVTRETLARINETGIPTWPYGGRPYLFGSLLWQEIQQKAKPGVVERLNQRYSRRLPFLLNAPLREEIDRSYGELYTNLQKLWIETAKKQLDDIRSRSKEALTAMTYNSGNQISPAISPNGIFLAYINNDFQLGSELRLLQRPKSNESFMPIEPKSIDSSPEMQRVSWLPDSSGFVYDKLVRSNRYYAFNDLYLYKISTGEIERLTKGLRAQTPSLSPDGKMIAFVQWGAERTTLALLYLHNKKVQRLFRSPLQMRISSPEFLDNERILFIGKNRQGQETFFVYNLKTKRRSRVINDIERVSQSRWTPNGLIFVSDQTGVANVYGTSRDLQRSFALTNTTTAVINADWDEWRKELIISRLTAEGPKLFALSNVRKQSIPSVPAINAERWPQVAPLPTIDRSEFRDESFQPLLYLWPRFWIPYVYPVDGGLLFQGTTSSQDPLGKNIYHIGASYDTVTQKSGYGIDYVNSSTAIDIGLGYSYYNDYLGVFDRTLVNRYSSLSFSSFIPGLSNRWRWYLNGTHWETDVGQSTIIRQGPTASVTFSQVEEAIPRKKYWRDAFAKIEHTEYLKSGDNLDYGRTLLHFGSSWPWPFPKQHYLSAQLKGVFAPQLNRTNSLFFGDRTLGARYIVNLTNSEFLVRGYPSGNFVGRKLINGNFEYHMPLSSIYRGWGTFPLFLENLEAVLFTDVVGVDGFAFDSDRRRFVSQSLSDHFWSTGMEFRLYTTAAYQAPISFTLGLYYGFDESAGGGFSVFTGIGYTGLKEIN